MQFSDLSYADRQQSDSVAGIYTGFEIINGINNEVQTIVLDKSGTLTQTSIGQVRIAGIRETQGYSAWRMAKKGGIDMVEKIYVNGNLPGLPCSFIGQDTCVVIIGYHATIDCDGSLHAKATNLTIKNVYPNPPASINFAPFADIKLELKKENFDDLLNGTN